MEHFISSVNEPPGGMLGGLGWGEGGDSWLKGIARREFFG